MQILHAPPLPYAPHSGVTSTTSPATPLGVSSSSTIPPTLLLLIVYKGIVEFQYNGRLGDVRRISQDIIINIEMRVLLRSLM